MVSIESRVENDLTNYDFVQPETNAAMEESGVNPFTSDLTAFVAAGTFVDGQQHAFASVPIGLQFQHELYGDEQFQHQNYSEWHANFHSQLGHSIPEENIMSSTSFEPELVPAYVPYIAIPILPPTMTMPTGNISASAEFPSLYSETMSYCNDDNAVQLDTRTYATEAREQDEPVIPTEHPPWAFEEGIQKTSGYSTSKASSDTADCIHWSTRTHATMNSTDGRLQEVSNSSGSVGNSSLLTDTFSPCSLQQYHPSSYIRVYQTKLRKVYKLQHT